MSGSAGAGRRMGAGGTDVRRRGGGAEGGAARERGRHTLCVRVAGGQSNRGRAQGLMRCGSDERTIFLGAAVSGFGKLGARQWETRHDDASMR